MGKLVLESVTYSYKNSGHNTLKDISFPFEAGKIYAIIGPSGSGKTTLLSMMAGLDRPGTGEIYLDGKALSSLDLDVYRKQCAAVIFQAFHLFPLLTALENVCYPMEMNGEKKGEAEARARTLLESVGIGESLHKRYPANLSGGEQQRVAIARALASGAKVLLADEPTGNLDVENGKNIIEILCRLAHDDGYCVIVVTHNPEIAESCDFTLRMSDGKLT